MPDVGTGMYTGGDIALIGALDIRAGTRVRVLVVSHPAYGDPEAEDSEPVPTLTEEELRFWQDVLDQQASALSARRAGTT